MSDLFTDIQNADNESLETHLRLGRCPNLKDEENQNPLLIEAVRVGNTDAVYLLLAYGAEIDVVDKRGCTGLHYAGFHASHILLFNGADPDVQDVEHQTPLHVAIHNNMLNLVKLLLSYGANHQKCDNQGRTPLKLAKLYKEKPHYMEDEAYFDETFNEEIIFVFQSFEDQEKTAIGTIPNAHILWSPRTIHRFKEAQVKSEENLDIEINRLKHQIMFLHLHKHGQDRSNKCLTKVIELKERIQKNSKALRLIQKNMEEDKEKLEKLTKEEIKNYKLFSSRINSTKDNMLNEKDYECPICFQIPSPPTMVYQCKEGHVYCSDCKGKPNMEKCPQCGVFIKGTSIRNRTMERLIEKLFLDIKTYAD